MCGICGQVRVDGGEPEREMLLRMCAALEHRGPDARGLHLEGPAGLGIRRLRVIDLETGDQPIYNEDRSIAVVLNGEIYNFGELRERLRRSGHRFATRGDTEVIAHLYEEEGERCVESLQGMFAFALWDRRRRRLLLARDRAGKKPLFYALRTNGISFASELRSLLEDREVPRELDHRALDAYFAYRCVPSPLSAFAAIRKLPPASIMIFDEGGARIERYWRLDYGTKLEIGSETEAGDRLRELVRAAVRRRMVADVPLGAFLSGGVDSSAVVAAMAEAAPRVHTFSIGFTSDDYNELPKARLVAKHFDTDHREFVVEPDAIEVLPTLVRHHGEPFADPAAIPSFYISQLARKHVTVALNGDGGDEMFGGYPRYVANLGLSRADRLPRRLRRGLGRLARTVPPSAELSGWRTRIHRIGHLVGMDAVQRHRAYLTELNGIDRTRLYTPEYRDLIGEPVVEEVVDRLWREATATDLLDRMLEVDAQTYLPNGHLVKMDIATMAHGLEGRSPLLDTEILEFAAALPSRFKLEGGRKKIALRAALRGWVPDEIIDAPKRGFRVPVADWLRNELRDYAHDVLLDPVARGRGYFDSDYVRGLFERHQAGRGDHSAAIWTLLVFELWHRELVDRPAPGLDAGSDLPPEVVGLVER